MKHENYSLGYDLLRVWARFLHRLIHKRITIAGTENLPEDKPIIFAPNHQNALMDAMAVLLATKRQPTWLARADIFKNKTVSRILYFLKISPVYRIRDGKENLGKNDEVFELSIRVLKNNKSLALFPEAQHTFKRQSAAHKKAVPRIAFMAEERENFNLDIHIVPTGIFYDNYYRFNREQIVTFGEPIRVKDYERLYRENPGTATIALRKALYEKLVPLTIHIPSKSRYEDYEMLREVFRNSIKRGSSPVEKLDQEKQFIRRMEEFEASEPEQAGILLDQAAKYKEALDPVKIHDKTVRQKPSAIVAIVNAFLAGLTFPLFLYGWLNFFLGFHLPSLLIRKKIKDRVFWATVEYVVWIIFIPLFLLIQWGIVWIITGDFITSLIYLITLPVFGKLALNLRDFYIRVLRQIRWVTAGKKVKKQLFKLHKDIITLAKIPA